VQCFKVRKVEVFRRNTLLLKGLSPWIRLINRARYVCVCVCVLVYVCVGESDCVLVSMCVCVLVLFSLRACAIDAE
jgi:hypothetical protein